MEFIQKKTADPAVEKFLERAAEKGIPLAWDRFEVQLPECGFCETGLSCLDCLQGPCVSHPFKDLTKRGVCGKDKDVLASQSLLRLALTGTLTYLDRISRASVGPPLGDLNRCDAMKGSFRTRTAHRPFLNSRRSTGRWSPMMVCGCRDTPLPFMRGAISA